MRWRQAAAEAALGALQPVRLHFGLPLSVLLRVRLLPELERLPFLPQRPQERQAQALCSLRQDHRLRCEQTHQDSDGQDQGNTVRLPSSPWCEGRPICLRCLHTRQQLQDG